MKRSLSLLACGTATSGGLALNRLPGREVLECAGSLALSSGGRPPHAQSARGLAHSRTLPRQRLACRGLGPPVRLKATTASPRTSAQATDAQPPSSS